MPFASVLVVLFAQLTSAGAFSAVPNLGETWYPSKCSQWTANDIQYGKTCFRDKSNGNHCCTLHPEIVPDGSDWEGGHIREPYIDIPWEDCHDFHRCGDTHEVHPEPEAHF